VYLRRPLLTGRVDGCNTANNPILCEVQGTLSGAVPPCPAQGCTQRSGDLGEAAPGRSCLGPLSSYAASGFVAYAGLPSCGLDRACGRKKSIHTILSRGSGAVKRHQSGNVTTPVLGKFSG
jgi:hypothetical protein